jgi:hypothetical protein
VVDINTINLVCDCSVIIVIVVMIMVMVMMVMGEKLVHSLGHAFTEGVVGAYRRHALAYACTRLADNNKKVSELTLIVVVTHLGGLFGRMGSRLSNFLSDLNFLTEIGTCDSGALVNSELGSLGLLGVVVVLGTANLN